jgi:serine/threonine-protein kinase
MRRDRNLVGTLLDGRYELRSLLGEGAFGRVYLGMDRRLARIVAIKLVKPAWAQDPEWVQSFLGEARLLARVSDPGIVQIFDVGNAPEGPYYVAEFVDGESLASRLRRRGVTAREACDIAEQLCQALAHAHEQLIVHRDVKPANILISARDRVKIGDFGVARVAESTTEAPACAVLGTPRYMAPEQARGERTSPAADVYSIGVVLYEMLAGHTPFDGDSAVQFALAHETRTPPPLPPQTPEALERVVIRALAKRPTERYPDAAAMGRALLRARPPAEVAPRTGELHVADTRAATTVIEIAAQRGGADRTGTGSATALAEAPMSPTPGLLTRNGGADGGGHEGIPTEHVERTRIAPLTAPGADSTAGLRRPSRLALPLLALGLAAAAILAVRAITAPALVRVPDLRGQPVATVVRHLHRAGLEASLSRRYATTPDGTAITQSPKAGARIGTGSTVSVVISKGAPPVAVPGLVGASVTEARSILRSLHLGATVRTVPAPGTAPGTVIAQRPAARVYLAQHRAVTLSVAEVPIWRTITSFSGTGAGASVPFQILGGRWRAVYSMSYVGTCTFILFCEGPGATVLHAASQRTVDQFGLGEGNDQSQVFHTGPGVYQIRITPGMDTAQWSVNVQDDY